MAIDLTIVKNNKPQWYGVTEPVQGSPTPSVDDTTIDTSGNITSLPQGVANRPLGELWGKIKALVQYLEENGVENPQSILDSLLQVDGSGSNLDSDMVDGKHVDDNQTTSDYLWTAAKILAELDTLNVNLNDALVHKIGSIDETITGNKTFQDNVTIVGNLEVQGTTTTIDTAELLIEDTIITLNSSLTTGTPPDTLKSGIEVLRGDEPVATFYWLESLDRWQFEQPINLQTLYFNLPNDNTDSLFITRINIDVDQTALRIAIGDDNTGDDYLDIGSTYNTWTSVFKVYNNGNAWLRGSLDIDTNLNVGTDLTVGNNANITNDLSVGGNITLTGTINGVTIGSSGVDSGLDADTLDGLDSTDFARNDLSNVLDSIILTKIKTVDGSGSGLDADTLDGKQASDLANVDLSNVADTDILNKVKNVDGSGSGLDADTVDGLQATSFIRSDANDSFSGTLAWSGDGGTPLKFDSGISYVKQITINDGQGNYNFTQNWSGTNTHIVDGGAARITLGGEGVDGIIQLRVSPNQSAGSTVSETKFEVIPGAIRLNGNIVWHAGNDGSGSGLDADTLDGQHASSFADTSLSNVADSTVLNKVKNVDGSGSGLDADTLDGLHLADILNQTAQARGLSTVSTNTTITEDTETYLVDASAGAVTITLDTTLTAGYKYSIKKIDSSANVVTLQPSSGTIDGQSSYTLPNQYDSVTVVCDGTNWWIV